MDATDWEQLLEVLVIIGHVIAWGLGVLAGMHR